MPFMSVPILSTCSPRVSRDSIFISKQASKQASKATHKIFKIFGLSGEALLFLANFFSPKAILFNLQTKSRGLVGNFSIYVTDVENWPLVTVGAFQQARYGARYA